MSDNLYNLIINAAAEIHPGLDRFYDVAMAQYTTLKSEGKHDLAQKVLKTLWAIMKDDRRSRGIN